MGDLMESENILKLRIRQLEKALELQSEEMHNVTMRPCATCRRIGDIINKPYGCVAYQIKIRAAAHDNLKRLKEKEKQNGVPE